MNLTTLRVGLVALVCMAGCLLASSAQAQLPEYATRLEPQSRQDTEAFAWDIEIEGDFAAVSSTVIRKYGIQPGSVSLYEIPSGEFTNRITAPEPAAHDSFGYSIDLDDGRLLVGAPCRYGAQGAAYLFDATNGELQQEFTPEERFVDDNFGFSVALSGNLAIITAPGDYEAAPETIAGSVYVFDVETGEQLYHLRPANSERGDGFGHYAALDGTTAVVGTRTTKYAYVYDLGTGELEHRLESPVDDDDQMFSFVVAIEGDTVVVSAIHDSDEAYGLAYVYSAASGEMLYEIKSQYTLEESEFADTVGISQGVIVLGAWPILNPDEPTEHRGSALLYTAETGELIGEIFCDDEEVVGFGVCVALDEGNLLISAPPGINSTVEKSVYLYTP